MSHMPKQIVITGSAGFVGANTVEHILEKTDWQIIGIDSFRHGGFSARVRHLLGPRYRIITHDLSTPVDTHTIASLGRVDYVLNLASNSHVDHSIENPAPFIENNTKLMTSVMDMCRALKPEKIIHCSTDEVYGPALHGHFHAEWDNFYPSNPYAASKVAQEAVAFSYWRTYGMPVMLTRCMNMIGPFQGREKFLPLIIRKVSAGEKVTIHGSAEKSGSRMYLHAKNLADAWLYILQNVTPIFYTHDTERLQRPEAFNVIGDEELTNLELAKLVASIMGKPLHHEFQDFHSVRPGHDLRYALNGSKLRALGWNPPMALRESIEKTIEWYLNRPEWLA